MASIAPKKHAMVLRLPGHESAVNAARLARTIQGTGASVTMVPYWPDQQSSWPNETPLLAKDIGSAECLSELELKYRHNLEIDLLALQVHNFSTAPVNPEALLPESIWCQKLRGIADRLIILIKHTQPDVLFIAHGAEVISRIATEVAAFTKTPTLYWESGFFPGHLYVDTDGPHFFRGMCSVDHKHLDLPPSTKVQQFIHQWMRARLSKYEQPLSQDSVFFEWKSHDSRPILFVAGQVPTDANAVVGLGQHNSLQERYTSLLSTLTDDWRLVFKPHPMAPNDAISLARPVGPDLLIADLDIHTAIRHANAVLVHSSNAGLEAALLGKAVLVSGTPIYSGKGITHDLGNDSDLPDLDTLSHPRPDMVQAFVQQLQESCLLADNDVETLRLRLSSAAPPKARQYLDSYYPAFIQALLEAAYDLRQQLKHAPRLSQAWNNMTSNNRAVLVNILTEDIRRAHPYGGPLRPLSVLAHHPTHATVSGEFQTLDVRLEECAFPVAFIQHALQQHRLSLRIGYYFDSKNEKNGAQNLAPEMIKYVCNYLGAPFKFIGNETQEALPTYATLIISPKEINTAHLNSNEYLDWNISKNAFIYLKNKKNSRNYIILKNIRVPNGQWELSLPRMNKSNSTLLERINKIIDRLSTEIEIIEINENKLNTIKKRSYFSSKMKHTFQEEKMYSIKIKKYISKFYGLKFRKLKN